MKDCYGKRFQAWDKCEKCPHIMACSIITLESQEGILGEAKIIV